LDDLDDWLMPLIRPEFLKLAFRLAEEIINPHRFSKEKRMASEDLYYGLHEEAPARF
jgi:hypothetical protein